MNPYTEDAEVESPDWPQRNWLLKDPCSGFAKCTCIDCTDE
jgi:hypothetical protein